jgi:hypothetical protein
MPIASKPVTRPINVHIKLEPPVVLLVDQLLNTGLHGRTRTHVVRNLIHERLRQLLEESHGPLKLKK